MTQPGARARRRPCGSLAPRHLHRNLSKIAQGPWLCGRNPYLGETRPTGCRVTDRRISFDLVTAQSEDRGLFRGLPVQIVVDLVADYTQNARKDLIIKGFVEGHRAIDVVFAGRRAAMAGPLMRRLRAVSAEAARRARTERRGFDPDAVRLPVRVEGSWRPRFETDEQGWQRRHFQFFAARWMLADRDGTLKVFGTGLLI